MRTGLVRIIPRLSTEKPLRTRLRGLCTRRPPLAAALPELDRSSTCESMPQYLTELFAT